MIAILESVLHARGGPSWNTTLTDCSASMSDGSESDRDNEPHFSALAAKQGK